MAQKHCLYLVPGFFGFANLGEIKYFGHVRSFLADSFQRLGLNVQIEVVKTHPTSSLPKRASRLAETIATSMRRRAPVHLIGHSSGGLDTRLFASPNVRLPTSLDVERLAGCVQTVVTVAAPHYGTPVATFFTGLLGQKLLHVLSLSTIYVLRFGHLPISALLQLGAIFARLDNLGVNSALLDELFDRLLAEFSPGRRRAVQAFFREVTKDQALLPQLIPEGMDLFNALTRDRPGVRYGSVITRARPPGFGSTLAAGLDPSAQATHAVFHAMYRLAARWSPAGVPDLTRGQSRALRRAYRTLPSARVNDGVVPTRSQVWGEVIHAAQADHLDVLGHFRDPASVPPHFDWLTTGSGFNREKFEALWGDVARYIAADKNVASAHS